MYNEKNKRIRLVIFDLDGVLIDSRENHFDALNMALQEIDTKYAITKEEHLSKYDALPTTKKLELLTKEKGLPEEKYNIVWRRKQEHTINILKKTIKQDYALFSLIKDLIRKHGVFVAVASNSITDTVMVSLDKLGISSLVDKVVSNEDVQSPKPFPEMYWKIMSSFKVLPKETLIIEDSHLGRKAVLDSGANLLAVENRNDLTADKVDARIKEINKMLEQESKNKVPWINKRMNVVIPMSGAGSRFAQAGYTFPKPLIDIRGKPMIQLVTENLNMDANFIFIVQGEHYRKYHLNYLLNLIKPGCKIVVVEGLTEGAACSVLLAENYICNDDPLVIANSDQFLEWNSNECMYSFAADSIDGGIVTFKATHPKWSYAKIDETGLVKEVAEKKVISNDATVGVYFYKKGSDFVKYAKQMIEKNDRVNNEFYVAPVFNYAIKDGKKIKIKEINGMWGIGTPEDLNTFLHEYKGNI